MVEINVAVVVGVRFLDSKCFLVCVFLIRSIREKKLVGVVGFFLGGCGFLSVADCCTQVIHFGGSFQVVKAFMCVNSFFVIVVFKYHVKSNACMGIAIGCVCVSARTCVCMCVGVSACVRVPVYVSACVRTCVCMCVGVWASVHACVCRYV